MTILSTAAFFSTTISPPSALGIFLIIGGAACYAYYSSVAFRQHGGNKQACTCFVCLSALVLLHSHCYRMHQGLL